MRERRSRSSPRPASRRRRRCPPATTRHRRRPPAAGRGRRGHGARREQRGAWGRRLDRRRTLAQSRHRRQLGRCSAVAPGDDDGGGQRRHGGQRGQRQPAQADLEQRADHAPPSGTAHCEQKAAPAGMRGTAARAVPADLAPAGVDEVLEPGTARDRPAAAPPPSRPGRPSGRDRGSPSHRTDRRARTASARSARSGDRAARRARDSVGPPPIGPGRPPARAPRAGGGVGGLPRAAQQLHGTTTVPGRLLWELT